MIFKSIAVNAAIAASMVHSIWAQHGALVAKPTSNLRTEAQLNTMHNFGVRQTAVTTVEYGSARHVETKQGDDAAIDHKDLSVHHVQSGGAVGTKVGTGTSGSHSTSVRRVGAKQGDAAIYPKDSVRPFEFPKQPDLRRKLQAKPTPSLPPQANANALKFKPTLSPTSNPTSNPTQSPTSNPTSNPTQSPTSNPTSNPTQSPTSNPTTQSPTSNPTSNPTQSPISNPWVQIGSDIDGEAECDTSGYSVSLSVNGLVVAIGAPGNLDGNGHVRVYNFQGNAWVQLGVDINGGGSSSSGWSVSLSDNGSVVAIGSPLSANGRVRIYGWNGSVWVQRGSDINGEAAGDRFGKSVSLSSDGNTVAIGAPENDIGGANTANYGHVRVYQFQANTWVQIGSDIDGGAVGDKSGTSVSLSNDGNTVAIGSPFAHVNGQVNIGLVRVYRFLSNSWVRLGADIDGEAGPIRIQSGWSVSLSNDGNTVAIGSPNANAGGFVRVYHFLSDSWVQLGADIYGEAAADSSGYSVSLSGDGRTIAIGGKGNDGNGEDSGHVRIYDLEVDVWVQRGYDINGEAAGDLFGFSVSLSSDGQVVAIGALNNDGNGEDSGHVRVYQFQQPQRTV